MSSPTNRESLVPRMLRTLELASEEIHDLQEGMLPDFCEGGEYEHSSWESLKYIEETIKEVRSLTDAINI